MRVRVTPSALGETRWYEYVVRFVFGGLVTALAGVIATKYGPGVGGLFLGFPAIFPASATLIEKHECKRKEQHSLSGKRRGRQASAIDAAGAGLGSIGLCVFGVVVWLLAPRLSPWPMLATATGAWGAVSAGAWALRKKMLPRHRRLARRSDIR